MYSLNVLDESEDDDDENKPVVASTNNANIPIIMQEIKEKSEEPVIPNNSDVDQTELVDLFTQIIRL